MQLKRRTDGERRAYMQGYIAAMDFAIAMTDDAPTRDWLTGIRDGFAATLPVETDNAHAGVATVSEREGVPSAVEPTVEEFSREALTAWAETFAAGPHDGNECRQCRGVMSVEPGDEPTVLCHSCAQTFIEGFAPGLIASALRNAGRGKDSTAFLGYHETDDPITGEPLFVKDSAISKSETTQPATSDGTGSGMAGRIVDEWVAAHCTGLSEPDAKDLENRIAVREQMLLGCIDADEKHIAELKSKLAAAEQRMGTMEEQGAAVADQYERLEKKQGETAEKLASAELARANQESATADAVRMYGEQRERAEKAEAAREEAERKVLAWTPVVYNVSRATSLNDSPWLARAVRAIDDIPAELGPGDRGGNEQPNEVKP